MSSDKKVLFITASHWNTPYKVGSHELALQFAKNGWKVGFVSHPISPFHLLKLNDPVIQRRFKDYLKGLQFSSSGLWHYVPFAIFPPQNYPLLRSEFVFRKWHKFTFPNVLKKIRKSGFAEVDLLYLDNAVHLTWSSSIKYKKSVFRIADNYSGYSNYTNALNRMEKELIEKVDLILYTAKNLRTYLQDHPGKRRLYFPNGVDYEKFAGGSKDEPEEIRSINKPRIIYIGEMEIRFDFDLIKYAAGKLPNFSFILIGNSRIASKEFSGYNNVYVLGIKDSNELSKYLYNSDVGIIPFNVKKLGRLINYVNPIKLYQYYACGLPVVSVRWKELDEMNTEALLFEEQDEFVSQLQKAVSLNIPPVKLMERAKANDWKFRYKQLVEELDFYETEI